MASEIDKRMLTWGVSGSMSGDQRDVGSRGKTVERVTANENESSV